MPIAPKESQIFPFWICKIPFHGTKEKPIAQCVASKIDSRFVADVAMAMARPLPFQFLVRMWLQLGWKFGRSFTQSIVHTQDQDGIFAISTTPITMKVERQQMLEI